MMYDYIFELWLFLKSQEHFELYCIYICALGKLR